MCLCSNLVPVVVFIFSYVNVWSQWFLSYTELEFVHIIVYLMLLGTEFSFRALDTLPKTNIAPTNGWLEYYFPIGEAYFQGLR